MRGEVLKPVLACLAVFTVGSILDNVMTYYFVVLEGRFAELNPLSRSFIHTYPLIMWFLRDYLGFALVILLALITRRLLKVSTWWLVMAIPSVVRILPVIHNISLLLGYDTPFDDLAVTLYRVLGLIN